MNLATAPTGDGTTATGRSGRRRRWLRTDEGWRPSEDRVRLLGAIAIAIAAVGLKHLVVNVLGGEIGYLSYLGAVALGAWVAGSRGGLITTVICAIAEALLFSGSMPDALASPSTLFRLGLFLFDGALVTVITSRLRRAMIRERDARATGETHLEARTAAHLLAEQDRAALLGLQEVTASLASAVTPADVADAILDRGMTALGAIAGGVSRLSEDGRSVELIAARGYPDTEMRPGYRWALDAPTHLRDAITLGRPVFLSDPGEWARRYPDGAPHPLDASPGGGSIAVLPLVAAGRTLGSIVFGFASRRDFDDGTGDLAVRLADQGAQALDRALAYDRERRSRQELERGQRRLGFLAAASERLVGGSEFAARLADVPALAVPSLGDWCVIELLELDRPVLAAAATDPASTGSVERLARIAPRDLGSWLDPRLATDDAAIVSIDGERQRFELTPPGAILTALSVRSVLAARIASSTGATLGSVMVGSSEIGHFGDDDLAMVRDLVRRIAAAAEQATLLAATTRFRATVDMSADAVFMFDPDSLRLTYVNRGGADLAGYEMDDLGDVSLSDLQRTVPAVRLRERLAQLRSSGLYSTAYSDVLTRQDGRDVPVDVLLQEVALPDGTRTAILTARDISDRIDVQARLARIAGDERRQAAELRAVIQAIGEGILVVDPDGRIALANEAAGAMLDGDVPSTVAELEARIASPADRASDDDGSRPRLQPGGPRVGQLTDGRWLEIATYPADLVGGVAEESGSSSIVVLRDVTRAREAEAAREAFLGVLSHELRTPVTTIFGYAKHLQRPSKRDDQAEMLADIEVEADRLYRIVEDLLALSRVEGGITIEGEPLLLQHLAGSVIASEALRWDQIRFEMDLAPDLPAVFGERTYVEQVLRNLVSNAGKYSGPGTAVTITAEATASEVLMRVLDRGSGISADESERLFDLHYRSPSTARNAAGAGIGLYVGRGLITAMGGRIWAAPREGGGSEFGFSLPRCEEDPNLGEGDG